MKFAHIGDTHIGAGNFKLEERKKDFHRAFEEAIDNCIENNVDIVIQTGDLFDVGRPAVSDIVFAIEQLARLKEKRIPFFTVPGSHDVYLNETPISILEKLGLVTNVGSSKYFEQKENGKTEHKGQTFGNYFIAGMPGYRSNVRKRYESLEVKVPAGKFSIFVFHHIVTSAPGTEFFSDIPMTLLPEKFNYYAGGHWHRNYEGVYNEAPVIYPGAIEHTDSAEMETVKERGMYIVTIEGNIIKPKWIPFVTRNIVSKTIEFNEISARDVVKKVIEEIPRNQKGSILLLRLKGRLSEGSRSEINRSRIQSIAKERGFLHCKVYLGAIIDDSEIKFQETEGRTLAEIEREYLQEQKYDLHTIQIAQEMMAVLGTPHTPAELESSQEKCVSMIDKFMGWKE